MVEGVEEDVIGSSCVGHLFYTIAGSARQDEDRVRAWIERVAAFLCYSWLLCRSCCFSTAS